MVHSKETNKSTKAVPEKDLMADILHKHFKTTALKMLKEQKEDVEKIKTTKYEQNGNFNKDIENLKMKPTRNCGVEKYSN